MDVMTSEGTGSPKRSYAVAVVVGVALILAGRSIGPLPFPGACTSIQVVSSSEKAALLSDIADDYSDARRPVGDTCGAATVVAKSSGDAAAALVRGWDEHADGSLPTVWAPVTSSWLRIVEQRLGTQDRRQLIPDDVGHVAAGPLVIAMPRPMANAMGWPDRQIGWRDLFALAQDPRGWGRYGHPEWGPFRLGKTNPNFSTSGLNALIGEYYAATGTTSDLTTSAIAEPRVRRFVQGVESSVVHYGDISITFLQNLRRADDAGHGLTYVSAVAIEEKSVWDYNQGNPTGDPATLGQQAPPATPLVAVYPREGTIVNDHPYAVLDAPWVTPDQRAVAADFLAYVQAPEQQARFQAAGFRDHRGAPGDVITQANGLLPSQPAATLPMPSPDVLDAIQRSWDDVRKRARVLLVIDVSGSMDGHVGSEGATKLELAKQAALDALSQFAPDDEVGLWIFSSDLPPDGSPWHELSPVSKLGPKVDALKEAIGGLAPQSGTALYRTVDDAVAHLGGSFDPKEINGVVVLTDGQNDYQEYSSIDPLIEHLAHQPEGRTVRVFCIAYGEDADVDALRQISDASFGVTYDASDPATIEKVFAAVLSNF
jgi:Ca-activated chloride channel homolog